MRKGILSLLSAAAFLLGSPAGVPADVGPEGQSPGNAPDFATGLAARLAPGLTPALPLTNSPVWNVAGALEYEWLGTSVASAGDVNGDGYADVIVGAPGYSSFNVPGRARVYLGGPNGLQTVPVWTVVGENLEPEFAMTVAPAGDVNGDGYAEVIVGFPSYNQARGRALVYLGSPTGPQSIPAWTVTMVAPYSYFGSSVSAAGDVNHDGYADIIVGAPGIQTNPGRAFLYLGSPTGLSTTPAWLVQEDADQVSTGFGGPVASAGDVDHDGYSDVLVSAAGYDLGTEANHGRVYLFRGGPAGLTSIPSWTADGDIEDSLFGSALIGGKDFNGDGFSDVAIGARSRAVNGVRQAGRAYVFLGSPTGLSAAPVWAADGTQEEESFGTTLSAGNFNGDPYADLVIGSCCRSNQIVNAGSLDLFLGSGSGLGSTPVWTIDSGNLYHKYGSAAASAGDVNGDGADDLLGGCMWTNIYRGEAYLFEGQPPLEVLDPMCITPMLCPGAYFGDTGSAAAFDKTPDELMQAQVSRSAAVADGVTLLLLRARKGTPVTFSLKKTDGTAAGPEWGTLLRQDGSAAGSSVTVGPSPVTGGSAEFAYYRAPPDFPGLEFEIPNGVSLRIEASTGLETFPRSLTLHQPPIVLVHGVWSNAASAWIGEDGGLSGYLSALGFRICDGCLVDYGHAVPAPSFDPLAINAQGQFAVTALVHSQALALRDARQRGIAATQVDVVGHSLGGLITRARVASRARPFRSLANLYAGDIHKIITIGSPHLGTHLADWLINHKCDTLYMGLGAYIQPRLESVFNLISKPLGPAIYGFQTQSFALEHLGATDVPARAIAGIEPDPDSTTEQILDLIPTLAHLPLDSVDSLLDGDRNHDTIVPLSSQGGNNSVARVDVPRLVHADMSFVLPPFESRDINETASLTVWLEVKNELIAPQSTFGRFPAFVRTGEPTMPYACSSSSPAAAQITSGAVTTIDPAPGTVVQPGDTVTVTFTVTGGNPVDGLFFSIDQRIGFLSGPGPFAIPYLVPANRVGQVAIEAGTFGPGPEHYGASTWVVVQRADQPVVLQVLPSDLVLDQPGEQAQIVVTGRYADGTVADLTSGQTGTTYVLQEGTGVVSVTSDGLVQVLASGTDTIVVTHAGQQASVLVTVQVTNTPPIIVPISAVTLLAETTLNVPVSATDPNGDHLRLWADSLPPFASFTDNGGGAGVVHLQPATGDEGSYSIALAVADTGVPALGAIGGFTVTVLPPCAPPPLGVPQLSVTNSTLGWTPLAGAESYDVVYGDLAQFWITGDFQSSLIVCLASKTSATSVPFTFAAPPGGGFWFLVRGHSCGGPGTWDDDDPAQDGSRDYLNASPFSCP